MQMWCSLPLLSPMVNLNVPFPQISNPSFISSTVPLLERTRFSNMWGELTMQQDAWLTTPIGKESESKRTWLLLGLPWVP